MIGPERFIARSTDRAAWLAARAGGVTATEVRDASTPSGFAQAVENRRNPVEIIPNGYMEFGSAHEGWIGMEIKRRYGILPNEWLIAHETNPRFLATPDGLSLDHTRIAEIKTGGKEITKPSLAHKRQMQWQLYVTGAQECVYGYMLRREVDGVFVPGWLEPKFWVVERDEQQIQELVGTAERLLASDEREAA